MTPQEIIAAAHGFNVWSKAAGKRPAERLTTFNHYSPSANLGLAAEHIKRTAAAGGTVRVNAMLRGQPSVAVDTHLVLDAYEPEFAEVRAVQRTSDAELQREKTRAQIAEKANRRLFATDIDTTGDFVDPRMAENPLLAWCQ